MLPFQSTLYPYVKEILSPLHTGGAVKEKNELTGTKLPRKKPAYVVLRDRQLSWEGISPLDQLLPPTNASCDVRERKMSHMSLLERKFVLLRDFLPTFTIN
ncbi:hypothetical protein TNCV_5095501 [Trichonephila clavipes]|nr:hypothetical protein TNCV_5095501 [Trichonephila clavipes]